MNRIKLLYDVMKTVKTKEMVTGVWQAQIEKDRVTIFSIQNEFEKNLSTGQTKAKITAAVDYEGTMDRRGRHAEETGGRTFKERHHGFHNHRHHWHDHPREGLKARFNRYLFALSLLNNLQLEEKEDVTIISLHARDLPEDMKQMLYGKIDRLLAHHRHSYDLVNECAAEYLDIIIRIDINKNCEVKKISLSTAEISKDVQAGQFNFKAQAELSLQWQSEAYTL
ncbi:hypothetical protein P22_1347 [Propionispora sp. 2/2-37]|uniref:hypothetical protein n=1 Tax=Propionispora sp. 2/2-37 TaxID=1677858 RepID=UPI0006BB6B30|nr:hypothetical protein [Propionispora sp. 2/2-37]CUH95277.1 hypothetical protein P22_1347 [Propionispora sp. 2/2-37]